MNRIQNKAKSSFLTGKSAMLPCKEGGCKCKGFTWIPSRPEEVGEFWFQRRRDFDQSMWRAKCRCKHSHEEHDPVGIHRCKAKGSNFPWGCTTHFVLTLFVEMCSIKIYLRMWMWCIWFELSVRGMWSSLGTASNFFWNSRRT